MNSPSYKSRLFAASIGLLLLSGVHTSVWAETTCRADVVFAMDNTGSMGGIIRSTTAAAKKILDKIGGGDPRFKGIDVQFAVTTYWGDPVEHAGGAFGKFEGYHWCGPTTSYPTRGTTGWYASMHKKGLYDRYRCDYGTPTKTSDDSKSMCRRWYGDKACDVASKGGIYIAMSGKHLVSQFDSKENYIRNWGRGWYADKPLPSKWRYRGDGTPGPSSFGSLGGIAVDPRGTALWVTDTHRSRIGKYTLEGKHIKWIGKYGGTTGWKSEDNLRSPDGIAVDSKNDVYYVVDGGNHRIKKIRMTDDKVVTTWSGPEPVASKWGAHGGALAVDSSGNVYLADPDCYCIKKYNSTGTELMRFGAEGSANGEFSRPSGIAVNDSGDIYVSDSRNHRIQKFDSSGNFLKKWGKYCHGTYYWASSGPDWTSMYPSTADVSNGDECLNLPGGMEVDNDGNLWVADGQFSRVVKYDPSGNVLSKLSHGHQAQKCGYYDRADAGAIFCQPGDVAIAPGGESDESIKKITGKSYKVNQQLTWDKGKVAKAMTEWKACSSPGGCGGDWPEANLFALHQIATEGGMTDGNGYYDPTTDTTGKDTDEGYFSCGSSGKIQDPDWVKEKGADAGAAPYVDPWTLDADKRKRSCLEGSVGWREKAGRVVVWFGDAPSHNTTVTREEAINVLNARNIVVAGINTRSKNTGMDTCHNLRTGSFGGSCGRSGYSAVGDPTAVAEATKGTMNHNVKGDSRVIEAILKGVSAGIAQAGSQAMVSFGVNESTSAVHMYISKFDSKGWTGDLEAWALNKKTGLPDSKSWSAAAKMDKKGKKTDAYSSFKDGGAHGGFRLDWGQCKKHSACKNDFNTGPLGVSDADGESRLNWLLGDTSKDGSSLRKREGLMGDVWHSSPVYVGASGGPWWDGMAYVKKSLSFAKFQKKVEKRKPVVYVGSNGGPLHAFDAKNGKELFAYYPRSLFNSSTGAGYHHLSEPRFAHKQVYVDGTPVVNDVIIDRQWQTVLVGTLANGGRGIFALNITDPERFAVGGDRFLPYLWEFTNEDDPHFGYSQGKPTIALMNSGDWAVLVGNGPDATAVDEDGGTSQLFILKISGPGPDGVWDLGVDYRRITTGMGETKNRNGGFSPQTVDLNGDGAIDRAYMGDLYSHIWAFDLSSRDPEKWKPAYGDKPLFSGMTEERDLHTQPITARPLVTRAPRSVTKWIAGSVSAPPAAIRRAVSVIATPAPALSGPSISLSFATGPSKPVVSSSEGYADSSPTPSGFSSAGELTPGKTGDGEPPTIKRATGSISKGGKLVGDGLMIYFGTGRFLSSADKTLMYKQFFYGVHDRGIPDRGTEHLVSQRFIAGGAEGGRITDPDIMVDYSKKSGWYIELPEAGERVVDRAVVRGNQIMFNTLVPDASVCASGGHGWEMSVLNHNGGSPRMASWDFDEDGVIGAGDRGVISTKAGEKKTYGYSGKKIEGKGLPSGSTIFGDRRFTPSSGADAPTETLLLPSAPLPPGRLSWIELQPRN